MPLKNFFKSYWHWVFAALLVPYARLVWEAEPSKHYDQPNCTEYHSEISRYEVIIPASEETAQTTKTKHDKKKRLEASLDCSGLQVQWVMADLTHYAFWAGVAGISLVLLTWFSTLKGVQITERIGKKQTKAYIGLSVTNFRMPPENRLPSIGFTVKNTGNSPAADIEITDISYKIEAYAIDPDRPDANPELRTFSDSMETGFSVFVNDMMAGEELSTSQSFIVSRSQGEKLIINEAIDCLKSGGITNLIEVFCNISYTDVFGDRHTIPFSFMGKEFNADYSGVDLIVKRKLTAKQISKMAKLHKGNNADKALQKAGLRISK